MERTGSSLIPVNPQKLPTLVSLDPKGTKLLSVRGTDLGLLSEEDTGKNLKRLIAGLSPQEASYTKDSSKRTELIRASAKKSRERTKDWEPIKVTVNGRKPKKGQWADVTVNISIETKTVAGSGWSSVSQGNSRRGTTVGVLDGEAIQWHVRAYMVAYVGYPSSQFFQLLEGEAWIRINGQFVGPGQITWKFGSSNNSTLMVKRPVRQESSLHVQSRECWRYDSLQL